MNHIFLIATFCFILSSIKGSGQYQNFEHQGLIRQYLYYAPDNLPEKAPLVFVFHGYSDDAASIKDYTQMNSVAEQNHFAVCYPRGTKDKWGNHFWNVGYEFHADSEVDDVAFVSNLAVYLQNTHNLSAENTFATGMSNGGDMSFLLACEANTIFKAVAPVCGTIMEIKFGLCTHPIPVFAINGDADETTWFNGDPDNIGEWGPYLSIPDIISHFVQLNNCSEFISTNLPDLNKNDGSTVVFDKYFNGLNQNEVWLYRIEGGGHDWPGSSGNKDIVAGHEIWRFFRNYVSGSNAIEPPKNVSPKPKIYPNPTDGSELKIQYNFQNQTLVNLYDALGKLVFTKKISAVLNPSIQFNNMPEKGLYTIVFKDANRCFAQKLYVN